MGKKDKISRREFIKKAARSALGVTVCGTGFALMPGCDKESSKSGTGKGVPEEGEPVPQNVLLITADDLGWRDLSCYGNQNLETPNIDRLATEGVMFENAFVTSSSCSPSRASLLTGQYPHTNGVDGLTTTYLWKSLPKGYTTLPSLLRDSNYGTAIEGKWHIAPLFRPYYYGYDRRLSSAIDQHMPDADRALSFIEAYKNKPFYLELNFMQTHRLMLTKSFRFDPDFPVDPDGVEIPEYWHLPDWPEIRLEAAMFFSQTMRMDFIIGQILNALSLNGIAEKTLVIFVSDNGPPFPGAKMTLYDRGIGTPLLFRWPEGIPAGGRIKHTTALIDVMPTVLEACGIDRPAGLQGTSFYSQLKDPGAGPVRDAVFAEMTYHVNYLPMRAIRHEGWKYIRNYSDDPVGLDQCEDMEWAQRLAQEQDQPWLAPRVPEELYDLDADPHEQNNLVGSDAHLEVLQDLRFRLNRHMIETKDPYYGRTFEENT